MQSSVHDAAIVEGKAGLDWTDDAESNGCSPFIPTTNVPQRCRRQCSLNPLNKKNVLPSKRHCQQVRLVLT